MRRIIAPTKQKKLSDYKVISRVTMQIFKERERSKSSIGKEVNQQTHFRIGAMDIFLRQPILVLCKLRNVN